MNIYEVIFGNIDSREKDFGGERESVVVRAETMAEAEEKGFVEIRRMFPNSEPEWEGTKPLGR